MDFREYFKELKRRNVFKAALAYLVVAWIIVQVASIIFPAFKASPEILRSIIIVLILGFPVWLIFAWVYEMTPDGLKKTKKVARQESITSETGSKFNKLILGALGIAIILLGANLYSNYTRAEASEAANNDNSVLEKSDKSKEEKSVAVLAFADMSPQKDQEYFSDGISEEILNYLAKNPELTVISRTSSFSFKGKNTDIRQIGEKLNANYVLEGSVRKADSTLRITAQLIHVEDGAHLWSETYDREMNDIFKIQDEIAEAVTKNLEASLLGEKLKVLDKEAYDKYLQAKHLKNQFTTSSFQKALELLKQSVEVAPNYAPAWAEMSYAYFALGFYLNSMDKNEARSLALSSASRSIEIDPNYAYGYLMLAKANQANFEWIKAKENIQKAYELEPANPEILSRVSTISFGSIENMILNTRKSIELDPLNYALYSNLSIDYFWNEEYDKAIKAMQTYEEFQPNTEGAKAILARYYLMNNQPVLAREAINKEANRTFKEFFNIEILYGVGEGEKAQLVLEKYISAHPGNPAGIASIYAYMGKKEESFQWLEKAIEEKDPDLSEYVYFPDFKKYHNDPRWQQLLEEMGVPEDNGIPGFKQS